MRSSELPRLTVEIGGASWQRVSVATIAFSLVAFSIMPMSRQKMLNLLKFSLIDCSLAFLWQGFVLCWI